jgi:hypothetical protein
VEVLQKGFEEGETTEVADGFLGLFYAAEFEESNAAGFFGGHARAEVVFDMEFEVGA